MTASTAIVPAAIASAQHGGASATPHIDSEYFAITPNGTTFGSLRGPGGLFGRLDATYRAVDGLARKLNVATTQPVEKLPVFLFDDAGGFRNYAEGMGFGAAQDLYGFYDRRRDAVVLLDFTLNGIIPQKRSEISRQINPIRALPPTTDTTETARRAAELRNAEAAFARVEQLEEQLFRTVVQHEIAHQVLASAGALPQTTTQPAWLSEGLACLFETPLATCRADDPGLNEYRLRDYTAAASLMSWRQIISDDVLFAPGCQSAATAYAQAWLLAYWALRENPVKLTAYIRNVRVAAIGPAERVSVFEGVFGPVDAALDTRLRAFANRLSADARRN